MFNGDKKEILDRIDQLEKDMQNLFDKQLKLIDTLAKLVMEIASLQIERRK